MPSSSSDVDRLAKAGKAAGCVALASAATAAALADVVRRVLLQPPRTPKIPKVVKFGAHGDGGDKDRTKNPDKLLDPPAEREEPCVFVLLRLVIASASTSNARDQATLTRGQV